MNLEELPMKLEKLSMKLDQLSLSLRSWAAQYAKLFERPTWDCYTRCGVFPPHLRETGHNPTSQDFATAFTTLAPSIPRPLQHPYT